MQRKHFVRALLFTAIPLVAACQSAAPVQPSAAVAVAPTMAPAPTPAPVPAQPPAATAPAPLAHHNAVVTTEMMEALKQLTAEDYKTRKDAVKQLQDLMASQFRDMLAVQTMMLQIQGSLTEQLRIMTQNPDPESLSRVAGLLEFNDALSRYAIDVLALPRQQSEHMLEWGMTDKNLPIIGKAYSRREESRVQAAHELAKIPGSETDWLLLQLLNDNNREVALGTIDALYDRPASGPITKAVWERATIGLNQYRGNANRTRTVVIHGRAVSLYDESYNAKQQDMEFAVDLLIKQKDPQVTASLNELFVELSSTFNNTNDYRWRSLSPSYGGNVGRAIVRLVDAFKPRQAIPFYYKAITANAGNDGGDTTVNNDKVRYSSRIDFMGTLLPMIGQDPEDYNIRKYANWDPGRWLIKGGVAEEEAAAKKITAWWKEHSAEYTDAATRPAEAK